jgi:hypothetical protein
MGIDEAESQPGRFFVGHLSWQGGEVGTLDLQIQEIAEEDGLLAVRAGTSEAEHAAEAVAVGAPLLAEVAGLARRALVDGVLSQGRPTTQGFSEESLLEVRECRVAEAERPLAARP